MQQKYKIVPEGTDFFKKINFRLLNGNKKFQRFFCWAYQRHREATSEPTTVCSATLSLFARARLLAQKTMNNRIFKPYNSKRFINPCFIDFLKSCKASKYTKINTLNVAKSSNECLRGCTLRKG